MIKALNKDRFTIISESILKQNPLSMDAIVRKYKLNAMKKSSFIFYRATAHIYFEDFYNKFLEVPKNWLSSDYTSWIQGDFHLQNVGFFESDSKIVFHLNDFDESYKSYFYLDIIRLISSIYLVGDNLKEKSSKKDLDLIAKSFLDSYVQTFKSNPSSIESLPKKLKKLEKKLLEKKTQLLLLNKWTKVINDQRSFNFGLEKLNKLDKNLQDSLKSALSNDFQVKDIAIRMYSGLGSLGVEKYYFLDEGSDIDNSDDKIFEIKEQTKPSCIQKKEDLEKYQKEFSSNAKRAKIATSFLLPFDTDYKTIEVNNKSYGIKEISPYKDGIDSFKKLSSLNKYCSYLGHLLAHSHIHSTKKDIDIDSDLFYKKSLAFLSKKENIKLLLEISKKYAQQVETDHSIFKHMMLYKN